MESLGIDFVGPFPKFDSHEFRWILDCVDYFFRYVWTESTEKDDSNIVVMFLRKIFSTVGVPVGMYMDYGPHFGEVAKAWATSQGLVWCILQWQLRNLLV